MELSEVNKDAIAIRANRIVKGHIRVYEACFFNSNSQIVLLINRLGLFDRMFNGDNENILMDLLDNDGNILQEIKLNIQQFKYLKSQLRFKVKTS